MRERLAELLLHPCQLTDEPTFGDLTEQASAMSGGIPRSLGNCGINPYEKPLAHSNLRLGGLNTRTASREWGGCGYNSLKLVFFL
jgi:hypothetical protein